MTEGEERGGLVRIGRQSFLRRMALSAGSGGTFGGILAGGSPGLVRALLPSVGFMSQIGIALAVVVVAAVVGMVIAARLVPGFWASADGASIRVGRHTLPSTSIERAVLRSERAAGPRRDLILQLHAPHLRTAVWLRSRNRILLTDQEQSVLLLVLEQSSIEPPHSAFDPTGRFTHINFPGALTKEEAFDVVHRMPGPGDPLPLSN